MTMITLKILKTAGKQRLELRQTDIGKRLVITDDWLTNWICICDNGKWSRDCGLVPNKSIVNFLDKNGKDLLKLQN